MNYWILLTKKGQDYFKTLDARRRFAEHLTRIICDQRTGLCPHDPPYDNSSLRDGSFWQVDDLNNFFLKFTDSGDKINIHPRHSGGVDDSLVEAAINLLKVHDRRERNDYFN